MSTFVPFVSSTPPPLDDESHGDSFYNNAEDDDDDEFGGFSSAGPPPFHQKKDGDTGFRPISPPAAVWPSSNFSNNVANAPYSNLSDSTLSGNTVIQDDGLGNRNISQTVLQKISDNDVDSAIKCSNGNTFDYQQTGLLPSDGSNICDNGASDIDEDFDDWSDFSHSASTVGESSSKSATRKMESNQNSVPDCSVNRNRKIENPSQGVEEVNSSNSVISEVLPNQKQIDEYSLSEVTHRENSKDNINLNKHNTTDIGLHKLTSTSVDDTAADFDRNTFSTKPDISSGSENVVRELNIDQNDESFGEEDEDLRSVSNTELNVNLPDSHVSAFTDEIEDTADNQCYDDDDDFGDFSAADASDNKEVQVHQSSDSSMFKMQENLESDEGSTFVKNQTVNSNNCVTINANSLQAESLTEDDTKTSRSPNLNHPIDTLALSGSSKNSTADFEAEFDQLTSAGDGVNRTTSALGNEAEISEGSIQLEDDCDVRPPSVDENLGRNSIDTEITSSVFLQNSDDTFDQISASKVNDEPNVSLSPGNEDSDDDFKGSTFIDNAGNDLHNLADSRVAESDIESKLAELNDDMSDFGNFETGTVEPDVGNDRGNGQDTCSLGPSIQTENVEHEIDTGGTQGSSHTDVKPPEDDADLDNSSIGRAAELTAKVIEDLPNQETKKPELTEDEDDFEEFQVSEISRDIPSPNVSKDSTDELSRPGQEGIEDDDFDDFEMSKIHKDLSYDQHSEPLDVDAEDDDFDDFQASGSVSEQSLDVRKDVEPMIESCQSQQDENNQLDNLKESIADAKFEEKFGSKMKVSGECGSTQQDLQVDEEDDFDDFTDFHTNKAADRSSKPLSSAEATDGGWSTFEGQDDAEPDSDWAAFSEPVVTEKSVDSTDSSTEENMRQAEVTVRPNLTVNFGNAVSKALGSCFNKSVQSLQSENVLSLVDSVRVKHLQASEETPSTSTTTAATSYSSIKPAKVSTTVDMNVWNNVKIMEETVALKFSWAGSTCNKYLLRAMNIDTRNILVGTKKSMPIYASSLGMLEPNKSPHVPTTADQPYLPEPPPPETSYPTQEMPQVQFDWTSSGLTNPLDCASQKEKELLESLEHSSDGASSVVSSTLSIQNLLANSRCSTTVGSKPDERKISMEALKILDVLPDLSFMTAKVLMFPLKDEAVES